MNNEQSIIIDLLLQYGYVTEKKTVFQIYDGGLSALEGATDYLVRVGIAKRVNNNTVSIPKKAEEKVVYILHCPNCGNSDAKEVSHIGNNKYRCDKCK